MYLSQTYGSESTLCAGACRGVEVGAEGQGWGNDKSGESGFGKTMQIISGV